MEPSAVLLRRHHAHVCRCPPLGVCTGHSRDARRPAQRCADLECCPCSGGLGRAVARRASDRVHPYRGIFCALLAGYAATQRQVSATLVFADAISTHHCGLHLSGGRHCFLRVRGRAPTILLSIKLGTATETIATSCGSPIALRPHRESGMR